MTRAYIDTNYLYVHLRTPIGSDPRVDAWRDAATEELGADAGVVSPLVIDEIAYRMVLAWLRDDGEADPLSRFRSEPHGAMRAAATRLRRLWRTVDRLRLEVTEIDPAVTTAAQRLMSDSALAPRDAFHASAARASTCELIVSSDSALDRVPGLRRLGPI